MVYYLKHFLCNFKISSLPLKIFQKAEAGICNSVACFPWRISANAPYPFEQSSEDGKKRNAGKLFIARDNKRGGWWPELS